MGIIFSKPRDYVVRKVDECKCAIKRKVDNTKSAILNKVHSSVQSVKQCLVTTKDDIVGSIVGVKDNICGRITRKVNCVCDACRRVRDNVVGKVNYAKNSVISAKNTVVNTVVSTKNGIVNRYTNTKNCIKDTYTQNKNAIKQKYSDIKNAKLTKTKKLKYSIVGLLIAWMLYVVIATSFDLYVGDFSSVEDRFCSIRDNVCTITYYTYTYTHTFILHTYLGLRHTLIFVWKYSKIISINTYQYLTDVKKYCYNTSKEAIHYILHVVNITFETVLFYFLELCSYIWVALCFLLDQLYQLSLIISEHVAYYSKIAWENFKIGSKVAYKHSKVGVSYAYKHGSVFLKDVSERGGRYLYYLITDFKHASVDGVIWSWGAAKQLTTSSIHATVEASNLAYHYSCLSLTFIQQTSTSLSTWSYETAFKLSDAFFNACFFTYTTALELSAKAYDGLIYASNNTYEAMLLSCMYVYDVSLSIVLTLIQGTVSSFQALVNASLFIYEQASFFMNEYGFEWLHRFKDFIINTTTILLRALTKFFSDLVILLYRFVTVTSERIYNIIFFFFFIIFKIFHTSASTFKFILSSLVIVMEGLFASIVWCMKSAIIAYSYFLSSYNYYRESIFFFLVTSISIYCSSVAKDRKISEQQYMQEIAMEKFDDDEDDDDDSDDDGDEIFESVNDKGGDDNDLSAEPTHGDVDFDSSFSHDDDDDGDVVDDDTKDDSGSFNGNKDKFDAAKEDLNKQAVTSPNNTVCDNNDNNNNIKNNNNNNNATKNLLSQPFTVYFSSPVAPVTTSST